MTTSRNPSARAPYPNFPLAVDVTTDQVINEGDMVYWDGVNGTLKPLTSSGSVALAGTAPYYTAGFCGVALGSNFAGGSTGTPPVYPSPGGSTAEQLSSVEVQRLGSVFLFCTAGEFYQNFTPVTVGATAQTVTLVSASTTNQVGWVLVPAPAVGQGAAGSTPLLETITGTGQLVEVWLRPTFPATTLV